MDQSSKKWVAICLATLLLAAVMSSPAQAYDLIFPQKKSGPITLSLPKNALTKAYPSDLIQVFVGRADSCCEGRVAMAGRYTKTGNILKFTPVFGFESGQDYAIRVRAPGMEEQIEQFSISRSAPKVEATVTDIFPSGDVLPENVLRFYIHFSIPMSPHVAFDYITLRDASGTADKAAFMRFKQELWNADRTRLTVLFDPGRIKREVATNLELGPALEAGQRYTLAVKAGWPSADGSSILPEFSKSFFVAPALRKLPDTRLWTATAPCAGTQDPLVVTFDRPFDRHSLEKGIRLRTGVRQALVGALNIQEGERSLSFKPFEPWPKKELLLEASLTLEDIAGNNFRDLLDHVAGSQERNTSSTELPISIRNCTR